MNFRDTKEFIDFLDEKGELLRIKQKVSSELEITEITDRVVKSGGPALLFAVSYTHLTLPTNREV